MIDKEIASLVGGGSMFALALAYGIRALMLRWSRDNVDKTADKGTIDLIGRQRDRINELEDALNIAYRERNEAVSSLGAVKTEIEFLRQHIQRLESQVGELSKQVTGNHTRR